MYTLYETNPSIEKIALNIKDKFKVLFDLLEIKFEDVVLNSQSLVSSAKVNSDSIFWITEGVASYKLNNKVLYYLDKGDCILPNRDWVDNTGEYWSDFAIKVKQVKFDNFMRVLCKDEEALILWNEIKSYQLQCLHRMLNSLISVESTLQPDFENAEEDEVLISQNSAGTDVYTLIEGELEVLVDGVKVGIIESDEIFGALAALTGTKRTATVKSITPSLYMKLPVDRFKELMVNRPNTVLKMIEDLSKTVVALNGKVVELTKEIESDVQH